MNKSVHVSDNLAAKVKQIQMVQVLPNGFRTYTREFKDYILLEYYSVSKKLGFKDNIIINLIISYLNINNISNRNLKPFNYYDIYHLLHS